MLAFCHRVTPSPVSANTLSWSAESLPSTIGNVLGPVGIDIVDLAVNGDIMYAATCFSTTANETYKSTDGGATWSSLVDSTDYPGLPVLLVAVAPDNRNVVAIVTAEPDVYFSTYGGGTWDDLDVPVTVTSINDIDVSVGPIHYVAVGGNAAGVAELWTLKLAIAQDWEAEAGEGVAFTPGQTTIAAVKFSPNFNIDETITVISGNATDAYFQVFRYTSGLQAWNQEIISAGMVEYGTGLLLDTITGGILAADIALVRTYLGWDETERIAFAAVAGVASGGGAWRLFDSMINEFDTWSDAAPDPVGSLAYNDDSGILLGGVYGDNEVYSWWTPMTGTSPNAIRSNNLKPPSGIMGTLVAWSGNTAVAATSGNESALAISTDDGYAWNDISMIDTTITNMSDVAVSANGTKVYLTTYDASVGGTNDVSVWVKASSWSRVLSRMDLPTTNASFLVRIAPEDDSAVYLSSKGTTDMWVSKDSGKGLWRNNPAHTLTAIQDFVVESADVVHAIDTDGATRSTNAGSSWTTEVNLDSVAGHMMTLAPNGDMLVGGSDGYIAFSKDSGSTFTRTTQIASTGNLAVQVIADKDYVSNNIIYAGVGTKVYRGNADNTTSFVDRGPSIDTTQTVVGMARYLYVIYALSANSTDSALHQALNLTTADTSEQALWSSNTTTHAFNATPQGLKLSSGPKLWTIDTSTDRLFSYTDIVLEELMVTSNVADNITISSATLHGNLDSLGDYSSANVSFEWGTTSGNLSQETTPQVMASTSAFSASLSNLSSNTTYYFRAKATANTTAYGYELSFTVPIPVPPTVTTNDAVDISTNSATLHGSLGNLGSSLSANVSFEWGTTSGNLTWETTPQVMASIGAFSAGLSNLSSNTTYYFRAKAVGDGTDYGGELNFTNLPIETVSIISWYSESIPNTIGNVLGPVGIDIVDLAVNGDIMYAATGFSTTANETHKSTDGGAIWTELSTSTDYPAAAVMFVAVASDDPNVVAIVTAEPEVYFSTDGGSSWTDLNIPVTVNTINDIDVSVGPTHYVAVGGSTTGGMAELWTRKLAIAQDWEAEAGEGTAFTTAQTTIAAVKFSPNFETDETITVISGSATNACFQVFRWTEGQQGWNQEIAYEGMDEYGTGFLLDTINGGLAAADIALLPTYLGWDPVERIAFAAVAGAASGGAAFRLTDSMINEFDTWSDAAPDPVGSLAYNDVSGVLLGGVYGDNQVYSWLIPMIGTSPNAQRPNTFKPPSGTMGTLVAWSGDTAVAATSGDESALAVSTDDGYTWNDISLIDTKFEATSDVAVSADGSKIYLTTHDATAGGTVDISVWVREASWSRVLSRMDLPTANAPFLVRIAPDDDSAVYLSSKGTTDMWVSKDSGKGAWRYVPAHTLAAIQDFVVESTDVVHAIDTDGATRSTNAGASWTTKVSLDSIAGHMITLAPNGDVLVGGSDGYIAFSKDSGSTFTRTTQIASTGNLTVQVIADKDYTGKNIIYAGVGTKVYRGNADNTTSFVDRGPVINSNHCVVGMAQYLYVIYALSANSTDSALHQALNLTTADTSEQALWSSNTTTHAFNATPQGLKLSSGPKLWTIDTNTDRLFSYTGIVLVAETSISQGLDTSDIVVINVNIDRIKYSYDNSMANITGGISSYSATVSSALGSGIEVLAINGVLPFDGPSFNATTGMFSVDNATSFIQADNTTVAELVLRLSGNATTPYDLTV
ncbi:hypothetical protein ACFLUU_09525, partial [Chloroflexota bacterium]